MMSPKAKVNLRKLFSRKELIVLAFIIIILYGLNEEITQANT
jgi:hypothetical protein